MKSAKRKTTKKQNVLIAFNKGIASAQSIELAMLFSHAGFDVKSIFFDGAEEYVSPAVIKEITEHSPWSATHKPGWLKADFKFVTGIVVEPNPGIGGLGLGAGEEGSDPDEELATELPSSLPSKPSTASADLEHEVPSTKFINCITNRCQNIKILTSKGNVEKFNNIPENCEIIELPDNQLRLHEVFEKLLADTVTFTASKALNGGITYSFNGDISNIEFIEELKAAFKEYGLEAAMNPGVGGWGLGAGEVSATTNSDDGSKLSAENHSAPNTGIIINRGDKTIEVVLECDGDKQPTGSLIYINKHKNGLVLTDKIETRLLPHFSCKSCFSKFVEYLREEMDRD